MITGSEARQYTSAKCEWMQDTNKTTRIRATHIRLLDFVAVLLWVDIDSLPFVGWNPNSQHLRKGQYLGQNVWRCRYIKRSHKGRSWSSDWVGVDMHWGETLWAQREHGGCTALLTELTLQPRASSTWVFHQMLSVLQFCLWHGSPATTGPPVLSVPGRANSAKATGIQSPRFCARKLWRLILSVNLTGCRLA